MKPMEILNEKIISYAGMKSLTDTGSLLPKLRGVLIEFNWGLGEKM